MGRRWSRKRKADQQAKKSDNGNKKKPNRRNYIPIVQGNPRMEAYYAYQGLHNQSISQDTIKECTTLEEKEEERMRWLTHLRTILPASFRIGTYVDESLRESLEMELEHYVGTEMEITIEQDDSRHFRTDPNHTITTKDNDTTVITKTIAPAKQIPFVPHAYQLSMDRRTIRRNKKLTDFHDWLKVQTTAGFVTRQETVSMIPPIVLDVQPHHVVLDMCAAPGSKTSQLLEQVSLQSQPNDLEPRGCVVANDSDAKRAYMLVHQLRRINSPAVLVTSCDAQFFPQLQQYQKEEQGMFDRVLADVPCSGDGTIRKNPGVWKNWSQQGPLSLHPLQISIAMTGARLTKVGGYICYSTCSMNPIENEAVVAELLRLSDGALELVDKRNDMPGCLARPGWTTWRVLSEKRTRKEEKNYNKKNNKKMKAKKKAWEEKKEKKQQQQDSDQDEKEQEPKTEQNEATETESKGENVTIEAQSQEKEEASVGQDDNDAQQTYKRNIGPPPSWDDDTLLERAKAVGFIEYKSFEDVPEESRRRIRASCFPPSAQEIETFHLEKCLRVLPHDMDTGGFFVALFQKVAPLSSKAKERASKLAQELCADTDKEKSIDDKKDTSVAAAPVEVDDIKSTNESGISETNTGEEDGDDTSVKDARSEESEANIQEDATTETQNDKDTKQTTPPKKGKQKNKKGVVSGNENFVPLSDEIWASLAAFYGFAESFPRTQFMARACGEAKLLYFIGRAIKTLIDCGIQERVTLINSGLKAFERNGKDCEVKYRVAQEGIHYVAPHMTKRKIVANFKDFSNCLAPGAIRLEGFSDAFASAVRPLAVGSFVVALEGYETKVFKKMFMVMWRCRGDAINCLVSKGEMDGMSSKLRAIQEEQQPDTKTG